MKKLFLFFALCSATSLVQAEGSWRLGAGLDFDKDAVKQSEKRVYGTDNLKLLAQPLCRGRTI